MNDDPDSTSLNMEISVLDADWHESLPDLPHTADLPDEPDAEMLPPAGLIQRAALAAFLDAAPAALRESSAELSLVLVDDAHMNSLNKDYRGVDKPTNVLSFAALDDMDGVPASAGPLLLGDVVLARETTLREAAEQGKTLENHVSHLVVHAVLHLLGFDHETEEEAEEMEGREVEILAGLGIADPYRSADAGRDADGGRGTDGGSSQSGQEAMAGSQ